MSDDDLEMFSFRLDDGSDARAHDDAPARPAARGGVDATPSSSGDEPDADDTPDTLSALAALAGLDLEPGGADDESRAADGGDADRVAAPARASNGDDAPSAPAPAAPAPAAADEAWTVASSGDDDAPWTAVATGPPPAPEPAPEPEPPLDRHEPVADIAAAEDLLDQLLAEAEAAAAPVELPVDEASPDTASQDVPSQDVPSQDVASPDAADAGPVDDAPGDEDDVVVAEDDQDGVLAHSLLVRDTPADDEDDDAPFTFSLDDDTEPTDATRPHRTAPRQAPDAGAAAREDPPADDDVLDGPFTFVVDDGTDTPTPAGTAATPRSAPEPTAAHAPRPEEPPVDDDVLDGPFTFVVDDGTDSPPSAPAADRTPRAVARPAADRRADTADPLDTPWVLGGTDDEDAASARAPTPLASGWGDAADDDRWRDDTEPVDGWTSPATDEPEGSPAPPAEVADDAAGAPPAGTGSQPDTLDDFADLFTEEEPAPPPPAATAPDTADGLDHLDDLALLFDQVGELDEDPLASAPPPRLEDAVRLDEDDDEPTRQGPDREVTRAATEGGFTAGDGARRSRRGLFRR